MFFPHETLFFFFVRVCNGMCLTNMLPARKASLSLPTSDDGGRTASVCVFFACGCEQLPSRVALNLEVSVAMMAAWGSHAALSCSHLVHSRGSRILRLGGVLRSRG